ncbi:PepSY domain-containing protein [Thioalkalicoccus limnaeus]|uniref:PepSY domain-containing protein n=1 Tax=Thioalkalicoccus limnaeus TaxID=120681 RepID=A0ABV4BG41_9GAMM
MKSPLTHLSIAILMAMLLVGGPVWADRDAIRMLSEAKISLIDAIRSAETHQGGQAIEAGLDDDSFRPAYEVTVVKDGRVFDVQVDAVNGAVFGVREDLDD